MHVQDGHIELILEAVEHRLKILNFKQSNEFNFCKGTISTMGGNIV